MKVLAGFPGWKTSMLDAPLTQCAAVARPTPLRKNAVPVFFSVSRTQTDLSKSSAWVGCTVSGGRGPLIFQLRLVDRVKLRSVGSSSGTTRRGPYEPSARWA